VVTNRGSGESVDNGGRDQVGQSSSTISSTAAPGGSSTGSSSTGAGSSTGSDSGTGTGTGTGTAAPGAVVQELTFPEEVKHRIGLRPTDMEHLQRYGSFGKHSSQSADGALSMGSDSSSAAKRRRVQFRQASALKELPGFDLLGSSDLAASLPRSLKDRLSGSMKRLLSRSAPSGEVITPDSDLPLMSARPRSAHLPSNSMLHAAQQQADSLKRTFAVDMALSPNSYPRAYRGQFDLVMPDE